MCVNLLMYIILNPTLVENKINFVCCTIR
jgi:hypothetical protein